MPFPGYLKPSDLAILTQAAVDGGFFDLDRSLHLQGIPKNFVLALKKVPVPLDQFQLDLNAVNNVERMADGEVPLVQFLQNAAWQLRVRGRREAEVFERYANAIGNQTHGVADLPEPSQLPEITKEEAIVGQDDMVDFAFLQNGVTVGRSVARVVVPRFENGVQVKTPDGKPWLMVGTAWMIGPQLAITNHHVINARNADEPSAAKVDFDRQGAEAIVEFDFDQADALKVTEGVDAVVTASKQLDYAILRFKNQLARDVLRLFHNRVQVNATTYMAVNIIQHPRGQLKRVAFRNNLVTGADNDVVRYFTDTDFGSSGSPVCDDNWHVLALHRGAKYAQGVKYRGKENAYVNFGSQIQAVLDDVKKQNPVLCREILDAQQQ